jgi:catechol 2,3-dioxygenase-like lactoylglutathione lyase family enzyme
MAPRVAKLPFLSLDYLYTPSRDVAKDVKFFTDVLGGRLVFAIDAMGTRVAKVELAAGPPHILLTDHLEGDRPVLVYRVADLDKAVARLKKNGWKRGRGVELPVGPAFTFTSGGGHRIALYEASRSFVEKSFEGRFDF